MMIRGLEETTPGPSHKWALRHRLEYCISGASIWANMWIIHRDSYGDQDRV